MGKLTTTLSTRLTGSQTRLKYTRGENKNGKQADGFDNK